MIDSKEQCSIIVTPEHSPDILPSEQDSEEDIPASKEECSVTVPETVEYSPVVLQCEQDSKKCCSITVPETPGHSPVIPYSLSMILKKRI